MVKMWLRRTIAAAVAATETRDYCGHNPQNVGPSTSFPSINMAVNPNEDTEL